jgi:hypothetical protein|tara:strand:+ start:825 stop:1133 length:309 start_codon:yes stop_codon:yes gene_type:complete
MNIEKAIKQISKKLEKAIEANEDALSWSDEGDIKKRIIEISKLEHIFKDPSEVENMYWYEMFDKKYKIPQKTQVTMIEVLVQSLEGHNIQTIEVDYNFMKEL